MSTFVTVGGSHQPFGRLLHEVERLAAAGCLPRPVYVQHGHTAFSSSACEALPFLTVADFEARIRDAGLVITHGGCAVFDAIRAAKTPVVMPRLAQFDEIVDGHQWELASFLAQTGRIVIAEEPRDLAAAIDQALRLQAERAQRTEVRTEPPLVGRVRQALQE